MSWRGVGCFAVGAIYGVFAFFMFGMIMMGDCLPQEPFHHQCESARSSWLLALIALSIAVAIGLVWAFFGMQSKSRGAE